MQTLERMININGKNARYYDLSDSVKDKGAKSIPAHFYGGNGFAAGVYMPLLTKLSARFDVSSLAMRGYWQDLPSLKKKRKTSQWLVLGTLKARPPQRLLLPNVPIYSHNCT